MLIDGSFEKLSKRQSKLSLDLSDKNTNKHIN